MATHQTNQEFYREVDRYRHRSGCLSLAIGIVVIATVVVVGWLVIRHFVR